MGCTWRADLGQCHLTFVNLIQASLSAAAVNARWACRKKKNLFVCFFSSLTKLDGGIAWSRPELHVQERCGLWVIKGKYCLMKACHCLALGILCRIAKRTYVNATCFGCWETSFGFHLTLWATLRGEGGDIKTATVYLHDWNITCNVNANLEVVFWLQDFIVVSPGDCISSLSCHLVTSLCRYLVISSLRHFIVSSCIYISCHLQFNCPHVLALSIYFRRS